MQAANDVAAEKPVGAGDEDHAGLGSSVCGARGRDGVAEPRRELRRIAFGRELPPDGETHVAALSAGRTVEVTGEQRRSRVDRHLGRPGREVSQAVGVAAHLGVDQKELARLQQSAGVAEELLPAVHPQDVAHRHPEAPDGAPEVLRFGAADGEARPERDDQEDGVEEGGVIAGEDQRLAPGGEALPVLDVEAPLPANR